MTEVLLTLLAYLLPFILEGAKAMQDRQKGTDHEANIQTFRKALNQNDSTPRSALLANQHDRVQLATGGSGRRS